MIFQAAAVVWYSIIIETTDSARSSFKRLVTVFDTSPFASHFQTFKYPGVKLYIVTPVFWGFGTAGNY